MKLFTVLSTVLLTVNSLTALCQSTKPVPANRLLPKIAVQATSLVVVDLAKDDIDGQVAACILQGIVNRTAKQKIYVLNTLCRDNHGDWLKKSEGRQPQAQMGRVWLKEVFAQLPQQELKRDTTEANPGFMALLKKYKQQVKGIIIFDPELEEATIEAGTTIAGIKDGIVVSPVMADQLKKYKFPVLVDFRGKFKGNIECLDWLKTNYFAAANKQVAFTWSHMNTDKKTSWGAANKDYVVANRLFTFFLNIQSKTENDQYEKIVKEYPAGTPILGWTDELKADKLFADYGYFMIPIISVENLSVMSSFPSVTGKQAAPKALPVKNNDVFIAAQISDGDNFLHTMIYEPYTIINSQNMGKTSATWIINPAVVDLAPPVFKWLEQKLGATQEMSVMVGDGSPIDERFEGFAFYCDWVKHYMDQSGMRTMKQMIGGESAAWRIQPYMVNSGYAGVDWRGIGPYEYHIDGKPSILVL